MNCRTPGTRSRARTCPANAWVLVVRAPQRAITRAHAGHWRRRRRQYIEKKRSAGWRRRGGGGDDESLATPRCAVT